MSRLPLDTIVDYYVKRGMRPEIAAGLAGNFQQESNADPTAINPKEGAYGLGQWRDTRRQALFDFAAQRGSGWDDPNIQLDFVLHELGTSETGARSALLQAATPENAASVFATHYERAGNPVMENRTTSARRALSDWFRNFGQGIANAVIPPAAAEVPAQHQGTQGLPPGLPPGEEYVTEDEYQRQLTHELAAQPQPPVNPTPQPGVQPPAVASPASGGGQGLPPGLPPGEEYVTEDEYQRQLTHELAAPPPPPPPNVPGSLSSVGQGVKSELNRGWQGLQRFVANTNVADVSGPQTVIADTPEEQAADAAANAWNAALVNRKTGQALQAQETEDQPYQQAHPWLFKGGTILGGVIESAPLTALTPALPAVSLTKGFGTALASLGKRALADVLVGGGTGALLTPLQPIAGDTQETYRQNLAKALAANTRYGAIAGPLADVLASGLIQGTKGAVKGAGKVGQFLFGSPEEALSPEARAAAAQYDLYLGTGDVTGSPVMQKTENFLANYLPFSGIPKKYKAGVAQAEAAAKSQRGLGATPAGLETVQEFSEQAANRLEAQRGEVQTFAQRFTPPNGLSADEGIQAGVREQLATNKLAIDQPYQKIRTLLQARGQEKTLIPAPTLQQAAQNLLDEMPAATRELAPKPLLSTLTSLAEMKPGESGLTFDAMRDLDSRLGELSRQARRKTGGIGDKQERAFTTARQAVQQDMDNWAQSTGNPDIMDALNEGKRLWVELKKPYTPGQNRPLNKLIDESQPEGAYKHLFNPALPEHAATNFNLLSANGQQSAKYGLLGDILQASEKNGQFDREAFLKACRERAPLIGKMLSPAEQKSFGDLVERINQNRGMPGLENKAKRAVLEEDPTDFMNSITKRDVRVQQTMAKLSPDGKQAMADYVIDKAYTDARDKKTGAFSLGEFAAALGDNAETLKQAGRWDELKGLVEVFHRTQRITQLSADPPTGQRIATGGVITGGAIALAHTPFQLVAYLGAGRALSAFLTNPVLRNLMMKAGRGSSAMAATTMQSPAWQRQFIKVLESVSSQPNNRPK